MRRILFALVVAMVFVGPVDRLAAEDAGLSFEVVSLPDGSETVITGMAEPGATVEVLDHGHRVAVAVANRRGEWAVSLSDELAPGAYRLTVRAVAASGEIMASGKPIDLVVPGPPPSPGTTIDMARLPDRIVVVPGDNLWVLARRLYGSGIYYRRLYEANRDIISRPRAIFPGQILSVPPAAENGSAAAGSNSP